MTNALGLFVIIAFLLGSCSVMTGDASHWPASALAVVLIVLMKFVNDRVRILRWPMEFLLASAVTMIVVNLARLYVIDPVF
jgi:UDP-N-acetylmuramyl pentapeptide phosphotransferase/UDP-N-acetylglucosamine-1-phosphate transferase